MGARLSKIITRTGDGGTTGLGDGSRVPKTHARIEAIGDVDECNSSLGVLLTLALDTTTRELLTTVQHHLFDLGGELAVPGYTAITEAHVLMLEEATVRMNADMPALKDFILPGGSAPAAHAHVCRAVARRAERRVVALAELENINPYLRQYMNRLSDCLFVLCRFVNKQAGVADVLWQKNHTQVGA